MINEIKFYIEYLKGKDVSEVLRVLKTSTDIGVNEKNLIYLYLFPRPLLDMELPGRIMDERGPGKEVGSLVPDLRETAILLEAYQTEQYRRFMKHLLHSYLDPENIFPILGNGQTECGLCKKRLFEKDSWDSICKANPGNKEIGRKEYLAFGSTGSNVNLCLDCIVQLKALGDLLNVIEPGYLNYIKR